MSCEADAGGELRRLSDELAGWAAELPHFHLTQQVRHGRFGATVLVGAVGVQSIAAAAGFRVDQRQGQIIAAEEPCERCCCMRPPRGITVGTPSSEARRDGSGGFHWL